MFGESQILHYEMDLLYIFSGHLLWNALSNNIFLAFNYKSVASLSTAQHRHAVYVVFG